MSFEVTKEQVREGLRRHGILGNSEDWMLLGAAAVDKLDEYQRAIERAKRDAGKLQAAVIDMPPWQEPASKELLTNGNANFGNINPCWFQQMREAVAVAKEIAFRKMADYRPVPKPVEP